MTLKFCTLKFCRQTLTATLLGVGALFGLTQVAARAVPVVINHSETAQPGDVIFFEGTWGNTIQVRYQLITAGTPPNVNSAIPLAPQASNAGNTHNSGSYVSVQIPYTQSLGLYAVWLNDGSGWSAPTYVNQAHGTHCSFNRVSPGFVFSVFGRNMVLPGYTPSVTFVDIRTGASYPGGVYPSSSTSYYLQVYAPSNVAVGDPYNVIVNNGAGGTYGSSAVEEGTTVAWANGVAAPSTTINGSPVAWNLNVPWQADYDGFCNRVVNASSSPYNVTAGVATEAEAQANAQGLQAAMNAASSAGGGVVYLPAGSYAFDYYQSSTGIMTLPSNVVLMGAGPTSTVLTFGYTQPPTNQENCLFGRSGTTTNGFLNIGFTNVGSAAETASGVSQERVCAGLFNNEFFLMGCALNMGTAASVDFSNTSSALIENSTITETGQNQGQMEFHATSGVVIAHDSFSYNCGRNWAGPGGGISDVLFYDNHFTRTAAVPSVKHYEAGGFDMYGNRVVFLDNLFDVGAGHTPNTNNVDGEQILAEEGGGNFASGRLTASSANSTSTTITDTSKSWTSGSLVSGQITDPEVTLANRTIVQIVSGPEAGEWSYITGNTSDTVTVSPALPVTPTAGDEYEVGGWTASEWLLDGNTFTNNIRAMVFNGSGWNNVVVNNTTTNDGGVVVLASQGALGYGAGGGGDNLTAPQVLDPYWDTQVYNNTIADDPKYNNATNYTGYIPSEMTARFEIDNDNPQILGTGILGFESRRNSLTVDVPNCGVDEGIPTPGTSNNPDNHLLEDNYLNSIIQEFDPSGGGGLFPRPSPADTTDAGILGSIYQGNTSANQTGTDVTRLSNGTVVNLIGSAYYLGTGVYDTTIADPIFGNVGATAYDPNGLNYNTLPSTGGSIDYQAEYGALANGPVVFTDSSATGGLPAMNGRAATGGELVGGFNGPGAADTISHVDGEAGGAHLLTLRYAVPFASSVDVYVNGTLQGTLGLPATGGWSGSGNWATATLPIQLSAGTNNTVKLQRDGANNAFNADKITVLPATATGYEAESGTLANGPVVFSDSSASGGELVGGFNGTGSADTLSNVSAAIGGTHTLTLRYAVPSASSVNLYVNGSFVTTLSLPATGGWGGSGDWSTVTAQIPLNAGAGNVIKLQRDAANNAFNADKIIVQ